jgi:predicted ATPase with chaperone activity
MGPKRLDSLGLHVLDMLMVGPPGAGKSMLAARLPGILPPLEPAEALGLI